jgi:FKBP-type peptidyl-prolyl cis-trans isomerase FkpA
MIARGIRYYDAVMTRLLPLTAAFLLTLCARPGHALDLGLAKAAPLAMDRLRLGVRDLPAAVEWLDKVLAWKPSYRDERRAVFSSGTVHIELAAADADAPAALVLASQDADADYGRLLARGAVSVSAPSDRPSGFREASVRGPGALVVELEGPLATPPEFVFTETAAGSGTPPGPSDTVKVHYVGSLKDGTVFDGAHAKGRAALIPLASAVRCWTQALARMKPGGKARFVCPPGMAYGAKGKAPRIPPNATLVYDVELVDVLR